MSFLSAFEQFLRAAESGDSSLAAGLFMAMMAVVGATIGSFLNVVVYRLPRGLSLSYPPSRCPYCGHAIRWRDNVPVLGWLWLGGKCRDCQAPISARYPLVEAAVAAMFAMFAWLEVVERGINLPEGTTRLDEAGPGLLVARYALHMLLLSAIFAGALIERDRRRSRTRAGKRSAAGDSAASSTAAMALRRLMLPVAALGLIAGAAWPALRPVQLLAPAGHYLPAPWFAGLVEGLCGFATGVAIGQGICFKKAPGAFAAALSNDPQANKSSDGPSPHESELLECDIDDPRPMLSAVGALLGMPAVCCVALGAGLWVVAGRSLGYRFGAQGGRLAGGVFGATVALLLAGRWALALEHDWGAFWVWPLLAIAAVIMLRIGIISRPS